MLALKPPVEQQGGKGHYARLMQNEILMGTV